MPVFAWKGETLEEYWWCTEQMMTWPAGAAGRRRPEHDPRRRRRRHAAGAQGRRVRARRRGARPDVGVEPRAGDRARPAAALAADGPDEVDADGQAASAASPRRRRPASSACTRWPPTASCCSRRSTSTTRSRSRSSTTCTAAATRSSTPSRRATDVMIGGKTAVVCGYGDVGKGCVQSLRGQGARVIVTEIDPINALQAAMEGCRCCPLDDVVDDGRHLRRRPPATPTSSPSTHMARMKHNAIVCNIGHFDNEIDMAGLARSGATRDELKPGTDVWRFHGRPPDHRPRRGPAGEPRLRHRSPELRDELLVQQPGDRPDRAVHQHRRSTRPASTCCPSVSTRRSPACTSTPSA